MIVLRWGIAFVVIVFFLFVLFGYKHTLNEVGANQPVHEPAATVEALFVSKSPYQQTTSVVGVSKSVKMVEATNELGGKIDKINFVSGDLVKKGQLLVEQDHSEESARLIAAQAKVMYQQKLLVRYKSLRNADRISEEILDKAVVDLRVSESEVAVLQVVINKKKIRAPFDAKAGIHNFQVGQYLEANSHITSLVGVSDHAWIDFYVPQIYDELALGSKVKVSLSGQQSSATIATVVSVEPMLTDESRHYMYRARISSASLSLKHNHLVKVTLPVNEQTNKIFIPSLAVSKGPLGDYVFLVKDDELGVRRAYRHKVELGDRIGDQVIVDDGLVSGDYIASTGVFKLRPGLKLFISEAVQGDAEVSL